MIEIFFFITVVIFFVFYFYNLSSNQKDITTNSSFKRLNPNSVQEIHKRAFNNNRSHNHQAALDDYNELISFNSRDTVAYFNRAATRKELGDMQGFFADLRVVENIHRQNNNLVAVELVQSIIEKNTIKTDEERLQESLRRLGYDSDDEW